MSAPEPLIPLLAKQLSATFPEFGEVVAGLTDHVLYKMVDNESLQPGFVQTNSTDLRVVFSLYSHPLSISRQGVRIFTHSDFVLIDRSSDRCKIGAARRISHYNTSNEILTINPLRYPLSEITHRTFPFDRRAFPF